MAGRWSVAVFACSLAAAGAVAPRQAAGAAPGTKPPSVVATGAVATVVVEPDRPATLSATAARTTFRLDIPDGAVLQPVTVTMRAARTSAGQPAVVIEPSGWVLLRPATLTVGGSAPKSLWSWGPAGHARSLRRPSGAGAGTRVLVGLGTVAGTSSTALPATTGETEEERFTRTEEESEAKGPDGEIDASRAAALIARAKSPKPCRRGDRAAAGAALQAARAATALTGEVLPVPSCVTVRVRLSASMDLQANLGFPIAIDESISAEGELWPTDTGHEGVLDVHGAIGGISQANSWFMTILAKGIGELAGLEVPPPSDEKCSNSQPYGGSIAASIAWDGGATARLRLLPTPPKYDWTCGRLHDSSEMAVWMAIRAMLGLGDAQPIELDLSVLEGVVRTIGDTTTIEEQVTKTVDGGKTILELREGDLTIRTVFSLELAYSLA